MCCNGAQLLFPSSPSPARSAPAPRQACACGQHSHPTQGDTMTPTHKPLTALHVRPAIETSLFDFFKIGPGPSSSHTIGPMRAGHDFVQRCDALDPDLVRRAARIHVVLLGSLSATGMGHGTNTAVLAGLLRTSPETCPAGLLDRLGREADARHELRIHDVLLQVGLADIEHGPIIHDAP